MTGPAAAHRYGAPPRSDPLAQLAGLLRSWAPRSAAVCAAQAGEHYRIPLADRALVDGAVDHRRSEFVAGRWCAHQALSQIQVPASALSSGHLGQPLWPEGVVGSITHEFGNCLALVMSRQEASGVGIDLAALERAGQLQGLADLVLAPGESPRAWCGVDPAVSLLRHFCAKEAVVKAVSATLGRFVDPREIRVVFDGDGFSASVEELAACLPGRWSVAGGMVVSYAHWP